MSIAGIIVRYRPVLYIVVDNIHVIGRAVATTCSRCSAEQGRRFWRAAKFDKNRKKIIYFIA